MLLFSWNVNGVRSALKKGLKAVIDSEKYDVILLQEARIDYVPLELEDSGYFVYLLPSKVKKGYSGSIILSKDEPKSIRYGMDDARFDGEGRVITAEFEDFYAVNAYFPNSRRDLSRLQFKLEFDERIEKYLEGLRRIKPVAIGGDFNVAHKDIDIARPKENGENAGFTAEERAWLNGFLGHGYVDTYRIFIKDGGHYTWWSQLNGVRERNIGWRIDYFMVSSELLSRVKAAQILGDTYGSDHAPVCLELDCR